MNTGRVRKSASRGQEKPERTPPERVQKVLARGGLGSRREIEGWITAGRVSINGKLAQLGDTVTSADTVRVDGRIVPLERYALSTTRVVCHYKAPGTICSRKDPEGRPTIFDILPKKFHGRWISVGRLDFNTSGLLLLTNHGELANRLMHPSREIEREYAVRILGSVSREVLQKLVDGVALDDGMAHFETVVPAGGTGANQWFHVTLREGRKREVRRLWESQGLTVSRLIRTRYGEVSLSRSRRLGDWWELEPAEVQRLLKSVDLTPEASSADLTPPARGGQRRSKKLPRPEGRTRRS